MSEDDSPRETEEQVIARHRKELRDLTAKITGMKKQATKKTRKDVNKQIEFLESDMKRRHNEELFNVQNGIDSDEGDGLADIVAQIELEDKTNDEKPAEQQSAPEQTPKKRNRRKEKLAKRQEEEQKMRDEAAAELAEKPDLRKIELESLGKLCELQGLVQHDITPDGHCLFASISDQLKLRHDLEVSIQELRTQAAKYIRENPDTFGPFLFDEETLTIKEIEPYCEQLENTAVWGGDMEILALAKVYNCPISVMFSGRSAHKVNEEASASSAELKLVYYKHSYGLGEHYNSLRDA